MLHVWPRLFLDVFQGADVIDRSNGQLIAHRGFWMQVNTNVLFNASPPGQPARLAFFEFPINPMIYGYCLPLFAGWSWRRRSRRRRARSRLRSASSSCGWYNRSV